ncbi:hypothetical protein [Actinacidiphila rubida]|uniref:Uncharacterized protein n=1 Tax=Actinacidiphila rubida TaxID=310780 RepID=A0A1H8SYM6_9ACTN|nr:hypothetical protein [Actinacidiphila rubida]SEO83468.1 hypothetical protein SAMN05216267_104646 [Actinacidiphila rubida]
MDQDQVWYATREDVRSALSSASTARSDEQIDRAIETGSRAVDDLCQRSFAPVLATRYKDWPSLQRTRAWKLYLDRDEVISVQTLTSAGVEIPDTDYYPEPVNSGPPYTRIETRLDRPSMFNTGQTHQRAIAITGVFGYRDDSVTASSLTASIDASQASITIDTPSAVGVGSLLRIGDERLIVTGKTIGNTGQVLQTPLAAKKDAVLLDAADGSRFAKGDVIKLGAESMLVRAVASNQLTVERAFDGTVLDSHSADAIWAATTLTVARGVCGTTAATAASGAPVTRWVAPAQARTLAIAEAMCTLLSEQAGYARTVRAQAGTGTRSVAAITAERDALRQQVADSRLARKIRTRAV